ncbi:unnamed protein product [Tilletia caries]|uniref:CRAL/TRIO N-terminal domain-containing protein n=1 Tax=Tilletia caries TaxID=13290 RepID=A0ABN7J259_9BASI|nr:unnamed protein product [Tilletia caries]CAD6929769.1 unnamed protein product [Tilletia controversa]CAD6938773.1 unnamed protein product [Tilletia caries]CAD7067797.1 unnamed protein product [Tilletia caries]
MPTAARLVVTPHVSPEWCPGQPLYHSVNRTRAAQYSSSLVRDSLTPSSPHPNTPSLSDTSHSHLLLRPEQPHAPHTNSSKWPRLMKVYSIRRREGRGDQGDGPVHRQVGPYLGKACWMFTKLDHSDVTMLRFLRAHAWDIDQSFAMLAAAPKFRRNRALRTSRKGEDGLKDVPGFLNQIRRGIS